MTLAGLVGDFCKPKARVDPCDSFDDGYNLKVVGWRTHQNDELLICKNRDGDLEEWPMDSVTFKREP